jgi:predicted DCC family thiol-disulfide oxidoreductase YuxK
VQRLGQEGLIERDMAVASNTPTPEPLPVPGSGDTRPALIVLYDGACPLCRREISVYRGLRPLNPDTQVCFADVSDAGSSLPAGTTRDDLLARFHVQSPDGRLLSGAQEKTNVFLEWGWNLLTRKRGKRIILDESDTGTGLE